MKTLQHHDLLMALVLICFGIFTFAVYLYSLCPTVYLIDSGELATVSYTLGIAHPTGYPLYTILSRLFTFLPVEPVQSVNLFSALLSVIAGVLVYIIAYRIFHTRISALLPALIFAFAPITWRAAVTNEVYALTGLFTVLIFLMFLQASNTRSVYILLYCIGLAFTNHVIIFSLALPVIIYLCIGYRPKFKYMLHGFIFFICGISLYIYLIARIKGGALIAWGGTYNLERLLWHVTGKQYQVWMFSLSFNEMMHNFLNGIGLIARNFQYIFLVPVFAGFVHLYRNERSKFLLFTGIILCNLLYAVNYSIPDIESYYIPAFCTCCIVAMYGFSFIKKYLTWFTVFPAGIALVLLNYNACSLRHNTFAYDYSRAHVEHLPENSLVIFTLWDIYSPTLYLQHVQNIRTDIVLIDKELLRRTWYIRYLEQAYPEFFDSVRSTIDAYMLELYKFEYGEPYNPQVIQARYVNMLQSFINEHLGSHNVYLAMPYPDSDISQINLMYDAVPYGLLIQILKDTSAYRPFDFSNLKIYYPVTAYDERLIHNRDLVKRMIRGNIHFLIQHGDTVATENAQQWLNEWTR